MRHPHTPYPGEDGVPPSPALPGPWPGQLSPIDESTTEVPVLRRASGQVADTSADGESAEVAVDTEQAVPDEVRQDETVPGAGMPEAGMPEAGMPDRAAPAVVPANGARPVGHWPPEEAEYPAVAEPPEALRPGDVAQEPIAVWPGEAAQRVRDQWRDLQVLFIDEPDEAVAGARSLVTEAVRTLSDRLLAEQEEFDPRRDNDRPDTEALRVAMRRYREFLDRVLAL